jgi:tetratricopeptide (TPR) repeat protein
MKKVILNAVVYGFLAFTFSSLNAQVSQADIDLRNAFKKSYEAEYIGKYAKAIEELSLYASSSNYEINIRLAYLNYVNVKYQQSAILYKKCIESAPKSIEARLGYVYSLAALEKWEDVLTQYKEILKIDPGNAKALYFISMMYFNRADFNTAQTYLSTYLSLYPFDFDGVNLAGWTKYNLGKKEEAISLFKKALLLNPSSTLYDTVLVNKK